MKRRYPASMKPLAGGIVAAAPMADAIQRLASGGNRPLILVDGRGMADDELAAALSRLDGLAAGRDLPLIVAIGEPQIDAAAAGLMLSRHQLLCNPRPTDWAAAIALAHGVDCLVLHDRVNEGEAARLARLNAEVARIADVLARLSKHDEQLPAAIVEAPSLDFGAPINDDHVISAADVAVA